MTSLAKRKSLTLLMVLTALLLLSVMGTVSAQSTVIRYANWNLGTEEENNLQRQLVAAYVAANPDVTIEFVDMSGEGGWEQNLTNLAARGELPDVFAANNTPFYAQNGWLADLTALVQDDADWQNVPVALQESVTYEGQILGLPSAQFVMGYFINQDLFEAANLDAPVYGTSLEDFIASATALTNVQRGILGLHEIYPILGWHPSTQDSNLQWYSFDGEHMNYNSDAFRASVVAASDLLSHTWQGLSDEQKQSFSSQGPWELFLNQEAGAVWDGAWVAPSYAEQATFNWDFLGIPGGNQAIVADIVVVSSTATDLEAAYDFARWMSFSSEGYATEAALATAAELTLGRMPVSVTPESIDLYLSFVGDLPGLRQALENLDNSLLESLAKVVPGYINARWEGRPGIDIGENLDVSLGYIFDNVAFGSFQYVDLAAQLETFANNILDEANTQIQN